MSADIVQAVLKKLGNDPEFRQRMREDAAATLEKDYTKEQLTDIEKMALVEMATGFVNDIKTSLKSWWKPTSFKEIGGATLSLVLLGLLIYATTQLFGLVNAIPQVVTVGNTNQVVDTYSRAKDLFSILFPLFAAVVSFWLGTAIEGQRADQNQQTAENESNKRETAEKSTGKIKAIAAGSLGAAKGQMLALRGRKMDGAENINIDAMVKILEDGENKILNQG
jgi:hypothetical protein